MHVWLEFKNIICHLIENQSYKFIKQYSVLLAVYSLWSDLIM